MQKELVFLVWVVIAILTAFAVYFFRSAEYYRDLKPKKLVREYYSYMVRHHENLAQIFIFWALGSSAVTIYLCEVKQTENFALALISGFCLEAMYKHFERRNFLLCCFWAISPTVAVIYVLDGQGFWLIPVFLQIFIFLGYKAYKWFYRAS